MNNKPIGVFDSGIGGLSVWRELRRMLPRESLLYFGDGLRCPYGSKPKEVIQQYSQEAVEWLLGEGGVKMIVVACNTATAAAINYLRAKYPNVILVGMEPAVKPALLSTKSRVVGVLATETSLKGDHYRETALEYGEGIKLLPTVGEGFVELVEQGLENSEQAYDLVNKIVAPLIELGADRLVLGCTHYPFLIHQIERVIEESGREVEIIDAGEAVAQHVSNLLKEHHLEAMPDNQPVYSFHTLAGEEYLEKMEKRSE